jgi:gliding motility-associated-like protein
LESKDNIEKIVKKAFENYEEPVSADLWDNISQQLPQNSSGQSDPGSGTSSAGNSTVTGNVITASKGLTAGLWGGAAIVAVTATTLYFVNSGDENGSVSQVQPAKTEASVSETEVKPLENTIDFENAVQSDISIKQDSDVNAEQPGSVSKKNTNQTTTVKDEQTTGGTASADPTAEPAVRKQDQASATAVKRNASDPGNRKSSETVKSVHTDDKFIGSSENATGNDLPEQVNEPATFRFELIATPTEGVAPLEVTLKLKTYSGEVTWDFGDGASGFGGPEISHQYEIPGTYTAWAKFTDESGYQHAEPVIIQVEADDFLKNFIPNVFTPNGDGTNDVFTIRSEQLTECEVTIFDRRGRQVARFLDPEIGWDGTFEGGTLAPEGTYFYVIIAKGKEGQAHNYKGTLKLIR